MSYLSPQRLYRSRFVSLSILAVILFASVWQSIFTPVYGAQLSRRSLELSSNIASATSEYNLTFGITTYGSLGSIEIQFCSNDPFPSDPCTTPTGMNAANATLASQNGVVGFSLNTSLMTANKVVLTRPSIVDSVGPVNYVLTNIVNPSVVGSYFVRIQTFASINTSGAATDYGGIAFSIVNNLSVSAEVPPYLIFCTGISIPQFNCSSASGSYIDFGELTPTSTATGSSQMLTATNAGSGYTVTVVGTSLTSGNDVIAPIVNDDVSRPGTGQFGLNLRANSSPVVGEDPIGTGLGGPTPNYDEPKFFRFDPLDVVISYPGPDNARIFTASYIVNVPPSQAEGSYVSTITYICLATF